MLGNHIDLRSYQTENCIHAHDYAQLVLPVSGSMELEVANYSGVINDETAVYIAPQEKHCFAGSKNNLFLVVDLLVKNALFDKNVASNIFNITTSTKKLIQFTHHYLEHNERDFVTDSLINQLILHFTTGCFLLEPDMAVMKAKKWIDFYFAQPVDIKKVAIHCYLSVSQLQRRFRQIHGYGLAEYWRMKKLHYAMSLLLSKNCSIEAIAYEVGYENLSAFSRRFNKVVGESPSQWRNRRLTDNQMRVKDK